MKALAPRARNELPPHWVESRADSAFCEQETIHSCLERGVHFTISVHGRTGWKDKVKGVGSYVDTEETEYSKGRRSGTAKFSFEFPNCNHL